MRKPNYRRVDRNIFTDEIISQNLKQILVTSSVCNEIRKGEGL